MNTEYTKEQIVQVYKEGRERTQQKLIQLQNDEISLLELKLYLLGEIKWIIVTPSLSTDEVTIVYHTQDEQETCLEWMLRYVNGIERKEEISVSPYSSASLLESWYNYYYELQ